MSGHVFIYLLRKFGQKGSPHFVAYVPTLSSIRSLVFDPTEEILYIGCIGDGNLYSVAFSQSEEPTVIYQHRHTILSLHWSKFSPTETTTKYFLALSDNSNEIVNYSHSFLGGKLIILQKIGSAPPKLKEIISIQAHSPVTKPDSRFGTLGKMKNNFFFNILFSKLFRSMELLLECKWSRLYCDCI